MKSTGRFILLVVGILTLVLAMMMTAFSLPAVHSGVHQVPIALLAPNDQVFDNVAKQLDKQGFKVQHYNDQEKIKSNIMSRKVYGAIILKNSGDVTVYEATAASANVAQMITQVGERILLHQKNTAKTRITNLIMKSTSITETKSLTSTMNKIDHKVVKIADIKPFPKADLKGAALAAGALPIALGGWIGAVTIATFIRGKKQKFYAVIAFSFIGGLALVAVIQFGIRTFNGNYILTSMAAMLGIAATGFLVLGILEVLGNPGLAIAIVLLILLGNPLSGLASAPEMLPNGWGALGQLLPPGATGTLLRNVAFFKGSATMKPIAVLMGYVVVGLLMFRLGNKSKIK
ncbi:ABC transporter permease [Leuconostoc falkenbergense]|uniref:ABC transporter permease n=1 Tax=Leuconostoc falkenbergense TaxID=2766470 RepID=UPI0024AE2AC3|nr:ABC transporter permease [Leuconostoc falkenbergense]MDI6666724.1 ABC transporter permease [Leuconostoc falkenbergense]